MGKIVAVYSEVQRRFLRLHTKIPLPPEGVRRVMSSPLRYCLSDNVLYVPATDSDGVLSLRLCWAHLEYSSGINPVDWTSVIEGQYNLEDLEEGDFRVGDRYLKRQVEEGGRFVPVDSFCARTLIDGLIANPEALPSVSPEDFEALCAELFVKRGFKVDLFRKSKDGGIDFLAVNDENTDPLIYAVQCKQPEQRKNRERKSVGRPVLQQIYGAAKAWDMKGGIIISGSTYSREAQKYCKYKPDEMLLYDQSDILDWLVKYRWNDDEI